MNDEGNVWVPRTVPYRDARWVAANVGIEYGQRLKYIGKDDAELVGFARDCNCDEWCSGGAVDEDGDATSLPECTVPAWRFQVVE